jgi:hypothetical protein
LAPGSICSLLFWYTYLTNFRMLKNLKRKICTYIFTCYMPTKSFHGKSMCCVVCVKRQILVLKISHFTWQFLSFST